jgi:succinoglycan biosynthesis transport protein ExoP
MELTQYARALRAHWRILAACVVACVAAAAVITALQTPQYEAHASLFVASGDAPRDQAYEGGLLAQQRARSYAELVSSPRVADAVAADLGSRTPAAEIARRLEAVVPVDTVLIEVTATSSSAREAQALAESVTVELPRFVQELETAGGETPAPVSLRVAGRPGLPEDPASPRLPVNLALGLLLGLVLGGAAVMLRAAVDDRVRTGEQAADAAGAPVLAHVAGASPEHYRRVWSSLPARATAGNVRLLLTSVGAEGAARTAVALGAAVAEAGRSVIVVDADLARPTLADLLELADSPGLAGALADGVPLESALQWWESDPRVELLPAGAMVRPAGDALGDPRLAELLDELSERAEVVVVIAAPVDAAADALVLAPLMSGVMVVTPLCDARVPALQAAARELATVGARLLGLVTIPPAPRAARRGADPPAAAPAVAPAGVRTGGGR